MRKKSRIKLKIFLLLAAGALLVFWLGSMLPAGEDIAVIPLDSRPVNTQYLQLLGASAGFNIILPPAELQDMFLQPANQAGLLEWLSFQLQRADTALVFANELFCGGLIASREAASYSNADEDLAYFREILSAAQHPDVNVFFILPRHLPSQYLASWEYREQLTRRAEREDRKARGETVSSDSAAEEIPAEILAEYENTYKAAYELARGLLELSREGFIRELVIGLDDSAPYGLNQKIYRELQQEAGAANLTDQVIFMQGADEISLLALAKKVLRGEAPVFDVIYLNPDAADAVFPYEGLTLEEMLQQKVSYLGGRIDPSGHLKTVIHSEPVLSAEQGTEAWRRIDALRQDDSILALADIAYTNRADHMLLTGINPTELYSHVDSFAGWNTAGNSVGTVLAHSIILDNLSLRNRLKERFGPPGLDFKTLRLVDDYYFQALARPAFNAWAEEQGIDTTDFAGRRAEADAKIGEIMAQLLQEAGLPAYRAAFPWPRSFEIKINY